MFISIRRNSEEETKIKKGERDTSSNYTFNVILNVIDVVSLYLTPPKDKEIFYFNDWLLSSKTTFINPKSAKNTFFV